MEKILELIKGEVCPGTYGLVELELRKLVEGQKPTTNSAMDAIVKLRDFFNCTNSYAPDSIVWSNLDELETILQQHQ